MAVKPYDEIPDVKSDRKLSAKEFSDRTTHAKYLFRLNNPSSSYYASRKPVASFAAVQEAVSRARTVIVNTDQDHINNKRYNPNRQQQKKTDVVMLESGRREKGMQL